MEESYHIISNQLGKDQHSKVYKIKGYHSGIELIIKIYEDSRLIHYNNETNILTLLNNSYNTNDNNNIFIMFKNIHFNHNLFPIPKEIKGNHLEFLFYNFLPKLSLLDYITNIDNQIKEIHAKFLCYKLLQEIEKLHSINISHNKLDISNIMFDDEFNLKIIHFSEANIINDKYDKNKDLFLLGQNIAKILSSKKFGTINYSKKYNKYFIYGSDKGKKLYMEESKFWNTLKTLYNINISEKFINFFHILIDAKKSKQTININELLKNEWLEEIKQDLEFIENTFKKDFKIFYEEIIEDNIEKNKINIDIKNILDESQEMSEENFKYPKANYDFVCYNVREGDDKDFKNIMRKNENDFVKFDYGKDKEEENLNLRKKNDIKKYKMTESSEEEKEILSSKDKEKSKTKKKKLNEEKKSKKKLKKKKELEESEEKEEEEEEEEESSKEKKPKRKYKRIELSEEEEEEFSQKENWKKPPKKKKVYEEKEESSEEEEKESSEEKKPKRKYKRIELSEEEEEEFSQKEKMEQNPQKTKLYEEKEELSEEEKGKRKKLTEEQKELSDEEIVKKKLKEEEMLDDIESSEYMEKEEERGEEEDEEEESSKEKKVRKKFRMIQLSEEEKEESSDEEKNIKKLKKKELLKEKEESSEEERYESSKEAKRKCKYKNKELNLEETNKRKSIRKMKYKMEEYPSRLVYGADLGNIQLSIEKEEKTGKKEEYQYEKLLNIKEINPESNVEKGGIEHKEAFYKPKKEDFNYLELNIKNKDNKDIKRPIFNFITKLKEKIKEEYKRIGIKININNINDLSFIISYEFKIADFNGDEIEFLDDNFEKKVKKLQKFEIKVELLKGDKNLYLLYKINQYYLIFNGISIDKEEFYEHLIILKRISKDLLLK